MSRITELLEMATPRRAVAVKATESPREAEPILNLPPLLIDGSVEAMEEFGCLHRNILILGQGRLRTLMICSAEPGEGTTTVAMNLASYVAREESVSTLLVEANFHNPRLSELQTGRGTEGLCEMLVKQGDVQNYATRVSIPRLSAICAGRLMPHSDRTWSGSRIESMVSQCESCYPFVVFDAPPVNRCEESLHLAKYVDGVVLVVKVHAPAETVQRTKTALERVRARILGVVLNRRSPGAPHPASGSSKA